MENSAASQTEETTEADQAEEGRTISSSLKFVIGNLKNIVPVQLSTENYMLWRSQVVKLFRANGFDKFLEPIFSPPEKQIRRSDLTLITNPKYTQWVLTDQNLAAALCSTISPSILPYIINLDSTSKIWTALENRFQSTNRSKVIQLKNELHNISMKTSTMTQYLTDIKALVDQIATAGSVVDTEDIILYILNGLPPSYQAFKTAIRTMITPISLDDLYPLLLSEEVNISADAARNLPPADPNIALYAQRGRGRRQRGRSNNNNPTTVRSTTDSTTTCQICQKRGHSAANCWHRLNENYVPRSRNTALAATQERPTSNWFLDSGASSHLTNSLDNLSVNDPYNGSDSVTLGDGRSMSIAHSGSGLLNTTHRKLNLAKILHIPELKYNLLSISKLTRDNNICIVFEPNGFVFKDIQTQQTLLRGPCHDGLYPIQLHPAKTTTSALTAIKKPMMPWHNRLGHPHFKILNLVSKCNPCLNIDFNKFSCSSCILAKGHKLPFESSENRRHIPLEVVHSDVWGPAPVESLQGYRFYVLFIDDCTRFTWLYPMKHKNEVTSIFTNFKNYVEKLTSYQIKCLRSDGGTEYTNHGFTQFLTANGITHQISCPYTPEQNGLAERKHRHILETTRSLLFTASVPPKYWPDAILTAVYLINRMPSSTTKNKSPFELVYRRKPEYQNMRTFGCACYPLIPPNLRHKLQPRARSCVFLGYSETYKGYKCLDSSSNKLFMSRHVTFDEHIFPFSAGNTSSSKAPINDFNQPSLLIPTSTIGSTSIPTSENTTTNTDTRNLVEQEHTELSTVSPEDVPTVPANNSVPSISPQLSSHPMITRQKTGSLKPRVRLNLLHINTLSQQEQDPTSYTAAVKHPHWRQAMASEFLALQKQGTWTLVEPPINAPTIGCKWTFRTKYHSDGSIARHKARLVALGNHQEQGIDYNETFSPVAKLPTIRILLSVALYHSWSVQQLDVANAFLHGDLQETIFMTQPKGFEDSTHPNHVCRLHKALYGLRQAPRQWYTTFTKYLLSIGFEHSKSDQSLLLFRQDSIHIFLLVYVDDILITGNNQNAITQLLAKLSNKFMMKHLGEAHAFLGIQIKKEPSRYFLSQAPYTVSILKQANMLLCNPLSNPTATKLPLVTSDNNELNDPATYRRLTGALQYLTLTRPDIAFSVNLLSQHMHDPLPQHAYLLKRLLRYLKGTVNYGLPITKTNLVLHSFSDADWAGDPISRKSTSGYCSFLGNNLISWTVKKQHTVARSSTESEYRSLAALTADILWLKRVLADFGIPPEQPTDLFCDNTSAIALANNPVFHARTKHIEIDQRFLREQITSNNIRLFPISTVDQVADILTKPLSTPRFHTLRDKLSVTQDPLV
ncbi:Retrovirus-related Pol polyprotein from transposon TNT 1-94 [Dendrobium catenatum]|uniref:Retrovirus-related Pol polyprotein from transposon TNT 1-94 n=1 Tax=Dendrobium catenatum TaxID=906689 RepID=A0A2I0X5B1_9ASPA|nr:Retrovirus-related Pol polyprotein from transposon TNT 1-94 [Dendrobium catenatum]